ncbi:MAG TPA: 4'-phosphopantetheinyl transferase superfamily protein [Puia sp.]|nr:4'-phosphopantetheinyl transferase superfamily protein [Puia sp.]
MPLLLYATEFLHPLPDETFQRLLHQLPAAHQSKITRFRRWEDAHAALLGKHLLRQALQASGSPATLEELRYAEQAKPWLPAGPNFNISHSGNRVVCLLATQGRVGIDIELLRPIDFEDFQTQFTPIEWAAIRSAADPNAAFLQFWTAKESLIKADGRGLQIPLLDLDVSQYRPITLGDATWTFQPLSQLPGYAGHLSTEDPDPEITFLELAPDAIAALF